MSSWRRPRAVFEETAWCGLSLASLFTPTHTLTHTHTHRDIYLYIVCPKHSQRLNKFLKRALLLNVGTVIVATKPLEMLVRLQLLPLHHLLCRAPCPQTSPNCHSFIHRCISDFFFKQMATVQQFLQSMWTLVNIYCDIFTSQTYSITPWLVRFF